MRKILILHGPNLNLLGTREPETYGDLTLEDINHRLVKAGSELGFAVETFQSNLEGELINALQQVGEEFIGIVFNPGGYTHTSVALRDAVTATTIPVIEVHISNVFAREEFRHQSMIASESLGKITGFGWHSYLLGMHALAMKHENENEEER
jgi:3-dehydroquinate dehydratase-2